MDFNMDFNMDLTINRNELPKTLYEIPDFLKLDKVVYYLHKHSQCIMSSGDLLMELGIALLYLENTDNELVKWFNNECLIYNKNHMIIFISEFINNKDEFILEKQINTFQRVISMSDSEYKLKLRKLKIKQIKDGTVRR